MRGKNKKDKTVHDLIHKNHAANFHNTKVKNNISETAIHNI